MYAWLDVGNPIGILVFGLGMIIGFILLVAAVIAGVVAIVKAVTKNSKLNQQSEKENVE